MVGDATTVRVPAGDAVPVTRSTGHADAMTLVRRLLVCSVAVTALACGGDDDEDGAPASRSMPAATTTPVGTTVPASTTPESTARQVLDDVLAWLNGADVDEPTYTARFSPAFVAALPFAGFEQTLAQLRAMGTWSLDGAPTEPSPGGLVAPLVTSGGERATLQLLLSDPAQPVIESLLIEPTAEPPASAEEAIADVQAMGTVRLATAEVTGEGCAAITDVDGDELMPLGSVFKVYVLGAVVDAIEAGTLSWETPVTIRDELDSLPSGTTQDEPAGTSLSVRELATRMISMSDNTATDHLIDLVGRPAVETALRAYGHAAPESTLPMLTTREIFILKLSGEALVERYAAASVEERRSILAGEVAAAPLPAIGDVTDIQPVEIETVEWFASPLDVCRGWPACRRAPEALEILAVNPGVPGPAGQWTYVGFKGGSEPGVLAVAWLVEDAGGRRFVLAGGVANPTATIAEQQAAADMAFLRDELP